MVNDIRDEYSMQAACMNSDKELQNHYLFLQHMQIYLLLRYAIKHADLGLLRRAIDRCCIYFHGSKQHKSIGGIHNGNMKGLLKARPTNVFNLDYLFHYCSLNSAYYTTLHEVFDKFFSPKGGSEHSTKSAQTDITAMAERLFHSSMTFQKGRDANHHATNLLDIGVNILCGEALPKFNKKRTIAEVDELILEESKLEEGEVDVDQFFVNDHNDSD
ncbi:MAG: hypothetical protein M1839_009376 [Geoglossum umbratile]|nr:MAG: hypothetical protein M1839_009376 [Geoglossum umbratile]